MILWNLPDKCPACKCKEVYPHRPEIMVPKPGELYFVCADRTCQNVWKTQVMTSRNVRLYVVHGQRAPRETPDGVASSPCGLIASFATNPADACESVGVDGEEGGYTSVDVYDLETLLKGVNRVDPDT